LEDVINVLRDPSFFGQTVTVLSLLAALTLLYFYVRSEFKKYILLHEKVIYSVSLQELARIWGANTNVATEVETIPVLYLKNFTQERTREFITHHMEGNMRFFPTEKLEIIFELFKILETDAISVPSVAYKFKNDPEKTGNYQSIITPDGKTSYDIFSEITLYDHTINVAEKCIEFLKDKDPISYETSMCDGIIVALAHDIGKLLKIQQYNKEFSDDILIQNPHQAVSKLFFGEIWAGYTSIEDAIYNHHSAPNATSLLTRMIVSADKEARSQEMLTWKLERAKKNAENKESKPKEEDAQNAKNQETTLDEKKDGEPELPTISTEKRSRAKERDRKKAEAKSNNKNAELEKLKEEDIDNGDFIEDESENTPTEQKPLIIAPADIEHKQLEMVYDEPLPIDFTDDLEAKIIAELREKINQHTLEKVQNIQSISKNDEIYFSITFYNSVIKKHVYTQEGNTDELKKIGMYISSVFHDKGYTQHMKKDAGCSIFFLTVGKKEYKFICIPFKASVFNMSSFELDSIKDEWLKSISISMYRGSEK